MDAYSTLKTEAVGTIDHIPLFRLKSLSINLLNLSVTLRNAMFKIQKFCMLIALHLCVLCGSRNKEQVLPYTALTD
jgi:hypothetical protein